MARVLMFAALVFGALPFARGQEPGSTRASFVVKADDFAPAGGAARLEPDGWVLAAGDRVSCLLDFPVGGEYTLVVAAGAEPVGARWPVLAVGFDDRAGFRQTVRSRKGSTHVATLAVERGMRRLYLESATDHPAVLLHLRHVTVISPEGGPGVSLAAEGAAEDVEQRLRRWLLEDAGDRIRQYRKGTLAVAVINPDGEPQPGVPITVEQVRHEFRFGTALYPEAFDGRLPEEAAANYRAAVTQYFNEVSSGGALDWPAMEPRRHQFDYSAIDRMWAWSATHRLPLRAVDLIGGRADQVPDWAKELSDDDLRVAVIRRVRSFVSRFRNKVVDYEWSAELLAGPYLPDRLGRGLLRQIFEEARGLNASVRMSVCERGTFGAEEVARFVGRLPAEALAVDDVGMWIPVEEHMDPLRVHQALDALGRSRRPVRVVATPLRGEDPIRLAEALYALLKIVFAHPAVVSLSLPDFWAGGRPGPEPALLDAGLASTPLLDAYEHLVFSEWWTRNEGVTDDEGLYSSEAFFGELSVRARTAGGEVAETRVSLRKENGTAAAVLVLGNRR
jgi:endo-1,4-beta-xylanase